MFKGEKAYLRQLEEKDVHTLLLWENDTANWRFSETEAPISIFEMKAYIESASQVRQTQQLRLIICKNDDNSAIGTVDLFEIDFKHKRAGIGILIAEKVNRQQGFAMEALMLIETYAREVLELDQFYCNIQEDNKASIQLFENSGYIRTGTKKNWYKYRDQTIDAYFYQKFID